MKKIDIILCVALALLAVGCKGAKYTSQGAYLGAMHEVETQLESMGFMPVGCGQETVNESFSDDDGWHTDWVTYDTRSFSDTTGCRLEYTVRYRTLEEGMYKVELAGCEVNCTGDYTAICGDDGVVRSLNHMPTDKQSTDVFSTASVLSVSSGILLPVILVAILSL